ncbi:uncharacterized protein RAG0_08632 [Rhynchosporium agropyri]|uniref:Uncharacterized protein n=1 Tax=Rhynchosporium agropyri TaxID=914238 RepID=A0A1E1KRQ3_9HELO|nr:uncharacterized protein RAG0_08632 [Rhynchosporium agropyri]
MTKPPPTTSFNAWERRRRSVMWSRLRVERPLTVATPKESLTVTEVTYQAGNGTIFIGGPLWLNPPSTAGQDWTRLDWTGLDCYVAQAGTGTSRARQGKARQSSTREPGKWGNTPK